MSTSPHRWAGLILAGGRSSRMGRDKANLPWQAKPLLEHLVQLVGQVVQPIIVAAANGQDLPDLSSEIRVVRDTRPLEGPLRGLREGLLSIQGTASGVLAVPVDAVAVRTDLLQLFLNCSGQGDIVVGEAKGRLQPLPGCYSLAVLPVVEERLRTGQRSLVGLVEATRFHQVPETELRQVDPDLRTYWPLNTAADWEYIRARLE